MTEENNNGTIAEATGLSVFGRVLGELMEARGIPADHEHFRELAEKGGLDADEFLARVTGESMEHVGSMEGVAYELGLAGEDLHKLARAYTFEHEQPRKEAKPLERDPDRIPRPDEIIDYDEGVAEDHKLRPVRCQVGNKTDNPCSREATTWIDIERRDYPVCLEHARVSDLFYEMDEWGIAVEITGDWLRVAQAWGFGVLEDLAETAHEKAKEGFWKAEAEANLVEDIADAKGGVPPDLPPEQEEKLRRLIKRTDAFTNARTALEDHATGKMREERLRQTLAVLVEEHERAEAEAQQYKKELGFRPT